MNKSGNHTVNSATASEKEKPPVSALPDDKKSDHPTQGTVSAGEKWFNRIVYSGLNYWVNLGISIVLADFFRNQKAGQRILRKISDGVGTAVSKTGMAGKEKSSEFLYPFLKTLTLLIGGSLVLFPMKPLEDNKRKTVHWLNKKLGVDQTAPDGHELTPDEIYIEKEQPRQTWFPSKTRDENGKEHSQMGVILRRIYAAA